MKQPPLTMYVRIPCLGYVHGVRAWGTSDAILRGHSHICFSHERGTLVCRPSGVSISGGLEMWQLLCCRRQGECRFECNGETHVLRTHLPNALSIQWLVLVFLPGVFDLDMQDRYNSELCATSTLEMCDSFQACDVLFRSGL